MLKEVNHFIFCHAKNHYFCHLLGKSHHHHHDIGRLLCQLGKDGRNQRDKGVTTNIMVNVSKYVLPKLLKTKLKVTCPTH